MNHKEFDNLIDCKFPYENIPKAKRLAKLACTISANAGFQVAYELAHVPRYAKAPKKNREKILSVLYVHLKHPLKMEILKVVRNSFNHKYSFNSLTVNEAVKLMYKIKAYRDQCCALNLVYIACDDKHGRADKACGEIESFWKQMKRNVTHQE